MPEIERYIRTVKERTQCNYNMCPFKKLPSRIIIKMVYCSIFWLNMFPPTDGISTTISPRTLIAGHHLDYTKHCRLEFGTYVQVHEQHDNSMATRTTGAIALHPTGNAQGGYYFYNLGTGRRLNRNRWTPLPMPAEVIDHIHALARRSHASNGDSFADRHGLDPHDPADDSDDETYNSADNAPDKDDDDAIFAANIAGVNAQEIDEETDKALDKAPNNGGEQENEMAEQEADYKIEHEAAAQEADYKIEPDEIGPETDDEIIGPETDDEIIVLDKEPNAKPTEDALNEQATIDQTKTDTYGERSKGHNLRPRRPRDYSHLHTTLAGIAMTQHSVKKGLKAFGDDGTQALLKELRQLHDRQVVKPKGPDEITRQQRHSALRCLMFLKKKRCRTIKARGCAEVRKQREYTSKEETSSPMVAIEALMLPCIIDAKEGRDVATAGIPGAFMQTDMVDTVHMVLEGTMAELLVEIDPKLYRKYLLIKKGKPVMYVQLKKALYGTLQAGLLLWKDLTKNLKEWGFESNPYDWCCANKMINGKQCTALWHVDDIKISHEDPRVVDSVLGLLKTRYGKEAPLTVTRGKEQDYLGMTLDYREDGKVKILMIDYIQKMLAELPDDMSGEAPTPAANHLFEVDESPDKLDEETAELFYHNVAKLLFLCKRA
jgi:hypothetical protein